MVGAGTIFECTACGAAVPMDEPRCSECGTPIATSQGRTIGVPISRRSVAWLVDLVLIAVILFAVMAVLGNLFPNDPAGSDGGASGAIGALAMLILPGAYFISFDSRSGQSPGRRVAKLRLAALDGRERLGLRAAVNRALWRYVSLLPCGIGCLWALGRDRRTWHDILSKCVVVPVDASIIIEEPTAPQPLKRARRMHPRAHAETRSTQVIIEPERPESRLAASGQATVAYSDELTHERASELVRDLQGHGHFVRAAEMLARDLRAHGGQPADWCRVALLLVDGGRPADALNVVNTVLLNEPGLGIALAAKALALLGLGSRAQAREALRLTELLSADCDPVIVTVSAAALAINDRLDEAEALLDANGDLGSEAVRGARLRLLIAELKGDDESALRWAALVADLEPFNAFAQVRAATAGSLGGFRRVPSTGRSLRVALRCIWRGLSQLDKTLPARARRLVRALELEPQSRAALRAVRRMGPARSGYVLQNALASLLMAYPVTDRAVRLLPFDSALTIVSAVGVIVLLRLAACARLSRAIPGELREWRRYAADLDRTPYLRNFGRSPQRRRIRPPADSVLGSAATCRCDSLNVVFGDPAVEYAWQHLAPRPGLGVPSLKEFICPGTLVRWLGFETTLNVAVPQLCRLDSGLTDLYEDAATGCI